VASNVFTHRYRDGGGSLTLDEAVIRAEALLNMCAVVGVCPKGSGSSAEQSLKALYAMRREALPRDVIDCCEQAPDPDSRVVLSHKRDRLGRRRLELHLRWSEEGKRTVRRGREILAEELTRATIGRFRPWTELDGSARPLWPGVHHPMGTTHAPEADPRNRQ
jgi:hypothetical protein